MDYRLNLKGSVETCATIIRSREGQKDTVMRK